MYCLFIKLLLYLVIIYYQLSLFFHFRKDRLCKGLATDLAEEVTRYALYNSSQSIEKHDPEDLPEINIVSGSNRRKYKNGKLHNLKR